MPIDHVNALPPGTRFEEYRLDAVLGAGGFGITYRAYDANLDKFVAIKEYLPVEFATRTAASTVVPHSDADAQDYHWGLTRFLDEARTLARFDHPHLNRVHRFFESNGTAYMVLEYVEGETLADRLTREQQLPEESLRRLLDEVLSGLEVMHDAGYVHRDIKPGNLMLREEDGSAVVLDFGAARQAAGQRSKAITSILTPGYAPIEQYDSKADDVGPWSDIYALGMVAYRCISGISDSELPDAVTRGRTQRKGQVDLIPAIEIGKGQYSTKLLEAIDWATEVDEENRPQTVDAWRQALAGGSRRKSPAKSVRKPATQSTKDTTTGRSALSWTTLALTITIIAFLGAGAWWGWQAYPELFGQRPGDSQQLAQQAASTDMPGETLQETESGETGEAVARTEQAPLPEKAEAEQPPPKEPVLSPEEAEVARLLAAAEADLKARRLTSPAGNNAWENYRRVLELVPAHPEAVRGMERVIDSYMQLFGAEVEKEDFDKAEGYLAKISELHPDSPVLEEGEQRLQKARQARADRLAEQERQQQAELERQRIADAIQEHWIAFETAIEFEGFDEAAAILNQIRTLNPEAPGLTTGEQRLDALRAELERQRAETIQAHWSAFEAAIQAEDLDEATGILAEIRGLHPEEPGLPGGDQRLEAAQAELKRKRQEAEDKLRQLAGEMVAIPGGTIRMGDLSGDWDEDARPVHTVSVSDFKLGKYEVTFAQWDVCVADGGCGGYMPDDEGWGRGDRPVINLSWDDVQGFIDWLNSKTGGNFRLPTEAEWEYAARAGSTTLYSWGNSIGHNRANCDGCGSRWDNDRTAPVGSFPANSWGLHDMHGNVWEWVHDCWSDSYAGAPSDGRARVSGDCNRRVLRGGSWYVYPERLHSASRTSNARLSRNAYRGFRLAQDK